MKLNYILPALSFLSLSRRESVLDAKGSATDLIKKIIRAELFSVGLRLLVGLVLVSIIVYSIVQFAYGIQVWLSQFENAFTLQMVAFTILAVASAVGLYFLFSDKSEKPKEDESFHATLKKLNVQTIAVKFMDGFMEGLERTDFKEKRETMEETAKEI